MEAAPRVIDAVVLAAGRGERMGGPKARLVLPDGPLVSMHVARFRACRVQRIVVVTRPECVAALAALAPFACRAEGAPADAVLVGAETAAPAESLASGLGRATAPWIFVTPIDALPASPTTLGALVAALGDDVDAVTPSVEGRGGHPVLVRRALFSGSDETTPLRARLAALGPRRRHVTVDDPHVVSNLDTPAHVMTLTGAAPRFL